MSDLVTTLLGPLSGARGRSVPPLAVVSKLRRGVTVSRAEQTFESLHLSRSEASRSIGINVRTLQRRKGARQRLGPVDSEKVVRLARVGDAATQVLGHREVAADWMKSPNVALGGVTPLSLLDTDVGAATVMDVLNRIDSGVFS